MAPPGDQIEDGDVMLDENGEPFAGQPPPGEPEDAGDGEDEIVVEAPPQGRQVGPPPLDFDPTAAAPRTLDPGSVSDADRRAMRRLAGEGIETAESGEEVIDKALHNLAVAREQNVVAEVYRVEPEEFMGKHVGGYIRKFQMPFDTVGIKEWLRQNRGGGKYCVMVYDGRHRCRGSARFPIEGDPLTPEEVSAAAQIEKMRALSTAQGAAALGAGPIIAAGGGGASERERDLERRLDAERSERQFTAMQQQTNAMIAAMTAQFTAALSKIAERPAPPSMFTPAMVTALAPILAELVKKPPAPPPVDHTKDIVSAIQPMMAAFTQNMKGSDINETILKTVLSKALDKSPDDSNAMLKKMVGDTLPGLFDSMMQMALKARGLAPPEKEEETGPESLLRTAIDAAGRAFANARGGAPQPFPGGPGGPGTQALGTPPMGPAGGQMGAPPFHPTMSPDPFSGSASVIVPRQGPVPGTSTSTGTQTTTGSSAPTNGVTPPGPGAPPSDFAPDLFVRALAALQAGRTGAQFATEIVDFPEDPDATIKAKDNLLSPRAVAFLTSMDAQNAAGLILRDIQGSGNPAVAPLLEVFGQAFVLDFCKAFSEPLDDEEGD